MAKPMDAEKLERAIMSVLSDGTSRMTYVIRNVVARRGSGRTGLKTPHVLRALKRLEKEEKVERVPSIYAVQLCWKIVS